MEKVQLILISRESLLKTRDGLLLLADSWDGCTLGCTLLGPTTLCDNNFLAVCDVRNLIMSILHELAGAWSASLRVEECVGIGCAIVGSSADCWEGNVLVEGIDCDDVSGVAGASKDASSLVDRCSDIGRRTKAVVDDLVADIDGVYWVPVATNFADEGVDIVCDIVDQVDTNNDLHAVVASGTNESTHVATDIVGASHTEPLTPKEAQFRVHLAGTSAARRGHQVVADTVSSTIAG